RLSAPAGVTTARKDSVAIMKPRNMLPESPRNALGLPRLKRRNATEAAASGNASSMRMSSPSITNNPMPSSAMNEEPLHNPSTPAIMLKAVVTATMKITVNGSDSQPAENSTSPAALTVSMRKNRNQATVAAAA